MMIENETVDNPVMPKWKPVPRSKAKTFWGVFKDIRKAIEQEPLRADMRTWGSDATYREMKPSCGVVGCIRGWGNMLLRPMIQNETPSRVACRAEDELFDQVILAGLNPYYWVPTHYSKIQSPLKLHFTGKDGERHYYFNSGKGDDCETTTPGTKAHARAVIKRIDRFMKVNEKELKRLKVPKGER